MENSDKDLLLLQSVRRKQSAGSNVDINPEPEQEQKDESEPDTQPESNQEALETLEPSSDPPPLAFIEFRIQQLDNRRLILQKRQEFRKKTADSSFETTGEMTREDSNEGCELEEIQKEMEELRVKKEELEKQGHGSSTTANGDQQIARSSFLFKTEMPYGGIYTLPTPRLNLEDGTPAADQIIPVETLGKESVVTRCPSCKEIISTETCSKASEAMWLLCCLLSMMGCVAGCCLIPFFMDSMKKVHHLCPHCQANIHTYQPL